MKRIFLAVSLFLIPALGFSYTIDSKVPAAVKAQMIDDLAFMNSIQGGIATPLHQQIFGLVDGNAYKTFFETRVTLIGYNACGGGNAVACVIPYLGSSKIWVTDNFIKFSHPQISRMMVVYHETRHTEKKHGNWAHATCPTPFLDKDGKDMKSIWTGAILEGQPACDSTPLGSYGSSTILLKNVQKFCTSCNEKVRMDAGIYADNQLGRITNAAAKKQMDDDFASGKRVASR